MSPRLESFFAAVSALFVIAFGFFILVHFTGSAPAVVDTATTTAQVGAAAAATTTPVVATTSVRTTNTVVVNPKPAAQKPFVQQSTDGVSVAKPQNSYSFPPLTFDVVNVSARAALVNILCTPHGGSLSPISGSGVLIDSRGVVLTNAHVAQYVLLSQSSKINLTCQIRAGAPAIARYAAEILYIPPVWVQEHAKEIKNRRPLGTGEHDYALLRITGTLDDSPLPSAFPFLSTDAREGIGFEGDEALVASYPAEFLGGLAAQNNLYPASSVTKIKQLLTFATKSIDLLSLGGVIEAQSGSSGGAVANQWGRLIGLITTTSEGATTDARDLRALTLSYISRDLAAQTQFDLPTILGGDVALEALDFNTHAAPDLINLYIDQLK